MEFSNPRPANANMSTRFPCYLAPLRKEWDLSQEELAALLPRGRRNRVSDVESGKAKPNAEEILAYSLIFGWPPHRIFPKYVEKLEDSVMRAAHALYERLDGDRPAGQVHRDDSSRSWRDGSEDAIDGQVECRPVDIDKDRSCPKVDDHLGAGGERPCRDDDFIARADA